MKNSIQSVALGTVKVVAVPLHMSVQLAANILNSVADGIAIGEGKVTHLIDNTKDEEEVAIARAEFTDQKFQEVGFFVASQKAKLEVAIEDANKAIDKSIAKVKETVNTTVDKTVEAVNKILPHEEKLPMMTPAQAFGEVQSVKMSIAIDQVNEPFVAPTGWRVKAMK